MWCLFSNTYCWIFQCIRKSFPSVCTSPPIQDSLETFYHRLIGNEPVKQCPEDMLLLQQTFPLLLDIVSIVEGDQLPEALTAFIIDLLEKVVSVWQKWINTRCCATGCTPHKWCRILSLPACGKKSWWLLPGWHNSKHLHKEEYSTTILTSWSFLSAL